jgi:predicted dehydrogenase
MTTRFTRRKFITTTVAAAGVAAGAKSFAAPAVLSEKSPNSKLGTAVIGVVNQGKPAVIAASTERLVALCDVDDSHNAQAKTLIGKQHPEIRLSAVQEFYDYRKMFDKVHKDIDAVFIAAPDHHHAAASLIAMRLGKHVYCEKPMAHSIAEVRLMMDTARKQKVMTQLGNQGHSDDYTPILCEYLWAGVIGDVTEVHVWAPTGRGGTGGRLPTKPAPAGLHWDPWIGPMPYRDYHDELHPQEWRSWWDFGDGSVGDWGCHNLDGPFMALKLGSPTSVEALEQAGGSSERYPLRNTVRWNYPARGAMPPVQVYWYDGYYGATKSLAHDAAAGLKQHRPPIVEELEKKYNRDLKTGGTLYVGKKGYLHTYNYSAGLTTMPGEILKEFHVPPRTLPRVAKPPKGLGKHYCDFLRACKDGKPASSHFDYSGPLTEMVLLACLAERAGVGKHVEWDAEKVEVANLHELNRLVRREYRPGWDLG